MGLFVTDAIVLRTRSLGEADQVVVLLTRTEGKMAVAARGVRRPRSRLLGPCQLFTLGRYQIYRRRSLHSLSQGHVLESFRTLREDLWRMACASYAVELADMALLEEDPQPDVFALVLAALHLFAAEPSPAGLTVALRQYELRLMTLLGYRPELDSCALCGDGHVGGTRPTPFDARAGGLLCLACARGQGGAGEQAILLGAETVAMMRQILRVGLSQLRMLKLSRRAVEELGQAMAIWIDHHLEKTPRSRLFLESLAAMEPVHQEGYDDVGDDRA